MARHAATLSVATIFAIVSQLRSGVHTGHTAWRLQRGL